LGIADFPLNPTAFIALPEKWAIIQAIEIIGQLFLPDQVTERIERIVTLR
jgi:hypothetical protein